MIEAEAVMEQLPLLEKKYNESKEWQPQLKASHN